jgi:hypothetical protein
LVFDRLTWEDRRVIVDGVVFEFQDRAIDRPNAELTDRFQLYKDRRLVDDYARLLAIDPAPVERMVELGLWDGGSAALWLLTIAPDLFLGVDLDVRSDSPYFSRFIAERGLRDRVRTAWGVDQADKGTLRRLVAEQSPAPLNLVVDDASHLYWPTRASFEALFPLLCPGGWYVVEDWAWRRWKQFTFLGDQPSPERMLSEVIAALGTRAPGVADVVVMEGLFAVRRAEGPLPDDLTLDAMFFERPSAPLLRRVRRRAAGVRRRAAGVRRRAADR